MDHTDGIETHPFDPFLPQGAKLLLLGTFPPGRHRWSVEFYYPNFTNDMWRIVGLLFFGDKDHFVDAARKRYRLELLIPFLRGRGIALYDTCTRIRRTTGTASDKDLEVIEPTDLDALLSLLPKCLVVATAGQLATTLLARHFGTPEPRVGQRVEIFFAGRTLLHFRMPSTSRAYPMRLEKKAEMYAEVFGVCDI